MKSVATPMLAIAIASMLVACTPPEGAQDTAVVLPLFHDLQEPDQDRVIDALLGAVSTRL